MRTPAVSLLSALIMSAMLAGCFGGDDAPEADDGPRLADDAVATEESGSVTGQIVAADLEVLPDVPVGLNQGGTIVMQTATDGQGRFTFNGVEPGTYRLQASAPCCKVGVKDVTVTAGEVTETAFQLDRLTADDLQIPFVDEREWNGFISCGIGFGVGSLAVCAVTDTDENEDFLHNFNVSKGVRDTVFVINWDAVGGVSGTDFWFLVENQGCGATSCSYTYADKTGPAPLRADVSDAEISVEDWKWSAIEDQRDLQFRVFASPATPNLVYQQPFTVYYSAFYYHEAPDDYDPLPDQ